MKPILKASIQGALIGSICGFFFLWLFPIYENPALRTNAGIWHSVTSVYWPGVLLMTLFCSGVWGWNSFRHDTELGRDIRLFGIWGIFIRMLESLFR